MRILIGVSPKIVSGDQGARFLQQQPEWPREQIALEPLTSFRSSDANILVATISAGASVLAALIAGLVALGQSIKAKRIVVQGRYGARLEMPCDTEPDVYERVIRKVQELDQPTITLEQ